MLDGGYVSLETSINDDVRQALVKLGHQLKDELVVMEDITIKIDGSVYYGASESRKDGHARF